MFWRFTFTALLVITAPSVIARADFIDELMRNCPAVRFLASEGIPLDHETAAMIMNVINSLPESRPHTSPEECGAIPGCNLRITTPEAIREICALATIQKRALEGSAKALGLSLQETHKQFEALGRLKAGSGR